MSLKILLKTLNNLRKGLVDGLPEATADRDPFDLFAEWYQVAKDSNIILPNAMALATSTPDGKPSSRMVLLKGYGPEGFTFYTNYGSRKAGELDANPHAALVLHWEILQRQVRIEGSVTRTSEEDSAEYFVTRPRGSQIGAWASRQSAHLDSRADLESRFEEIKKRFDGKEVPLPPFWGGYRVDPIRIEFWQGKANRLHDRLLYIRDGDRWTTERLYP